VFETAFGLFDTSPATLEIGSGSGQATRDLAAGSSRLDCVEPGADFAFHLRSKFDELSHVEIFNQDFEQFQPARGYDLVFSGSALHWVPKNIALSKIQEQLNPGGWLVTVWNQFAIAPLVAELVEKEVISDFADFQLPIFEPDVHEERFAGNLKELCEDWEFHSCKMDILKRTRVVDSSTFVALLESYTNIANRDKEQVKETFARTAQALAAANLESIEILDYFPMAIAQKS